MLQRLEYFSPSILIIGAVGICHIAGLIFLNLRYKRQLKSISWIFEHAKILWVAFLSLRFIGPFAEELFFRIPLVLIFKTLSQSAWASIIGSATIFSLLHLSNTFISPRDFQSLKNDYSKGNLKTDDIWQALEPNQNERLVSDRVPKLIQLTFSFIVGVVAGYLGIKNQSLWAPVIVHVLANSISFILEVVLFLFTILKSRVILPVYEWIKYR